MADPRIAGLAQVLVDYSVGVREGDRAIIFCDPPAAPLIEEVYRRVLQRGGHPFVMVELPGLNRIFMEEAGDAQLDYVPPVRQAMGEQFDVQFSISAKANLREMTSIPPERQARRSQATRSMMKTFMERSASGALRWTVALYPTDAQAQEANMATSEFAGFIYHACLVDQPDPIAAWREVSRRQKRLVDWLKGKQEVRLVGPGTDLRVGIAGRTFINCDGDKNMPDGEVFTGPEETRVDGTVCFSFPAIYQGREVENVQLWFEQGRVVKWAAAKNEDFLGQMINLDSGACRLGEFAFGTNYGIQRFVKNMLFDEKIGGTVHMALGAGYPESGSQNESGIHWDMLCDLRQGGEVWVDGELFAKDGKYLLWE